MNDKDTMSGIAMVVGGLVLVAVVIFFVANLFSTVEENSTAGSGDSMKQQLIEERLARVGSVATFDPNAAPKVRSAGEIYTGVCSACHATGALGAPKPGEWGPRLKKGMGTLLKHATNGFNSMPARGGDASLSDEDIEKTIKYMSKL